MADELTPSQAASKHDSTFRRFWQAYPRHTHREESARAWGLLMEDGADPVAIVKAAEGFAANLSDVKYAPAAVNWLKNGRYEDADLFSDESAANEEWLRRMYRTANVKAVQDRFQLTMPKWYPPRDGMSEAEQRAAYRAAVQSWIVDVHKEYFGCPTPPSTTSEPSRPSSDPSSTPPDDSLTCGA